VKLLTQSPIEGQRMGITTSQCLERQSYGQTSSSERLNQWTLQSAWGWSRLHELWNLESIKIVGWIVSPISHKQDLSQSKIGMTWMLSRSPRGTYCDYCKMRWSVKDWRGQKQAIWQVTSKRNGKVFVRHYCHDCTQEIQDWNGKTWMLQEQIEYGKGQDKLDV